jgi:hypothetical protein
MIHGTVCFKCWGKGVVPAKISGVKFTSLMEYATEGDIVDVRGVGAARVVEVQKGDFIRKEQDMFGISEMHYPEKVIYVSLINEKKYAVLRHTPTMERETKNGIMVVNKKTNIWSKKK